MPLTPRGMDEEDMVPMHPQGSFERPITEVYSVQIGNDGTDARATEFTKNEKACCKHGVWSIGGVVGMLSFASVAISVSFSVVLLAATFTDALNDTRDQHEVANAECYDMANTMVQNTMQQMMRPSISATVGEVQMFLDGSIGVIDRMSVFHNTIAAIPKGDGAYTSAFAPHIWREVQSLLLQILHNSQPIASRGCGIYTGDRGLTNFLLIPGFDGSDGMIFSFLTEGNVSSAGPATPYAGLPLEFAFRDPASGVVLQRFPQRTAGFSPTMLQVVGVIREYPDEFAYGDTIWGPLDSIAGFLGYMLATKLPDPTGTHPSVEALAFIDLDGIGTLFSAIVEKSCEDFRGEGEACPPMRLFSTVRNNWVADLKRRRNASDWQRWDQTGLLTGASHGSTARFVPGIDTFGAAGFIAAPVQDTNISDPVIRMAAEHIHGIGGYDAVIEGDANGFIIAQLPLDMDLYRVYRNETDQGRGVWWDPMAQNVGEWRNLSGTAGATTEFVMVLSTIYDPRGLDWALTFISPTQPLLEEVARIRIEQEVLAEKDKDALERHVSRRTLWTYVGVALLGAICAFVATMIVQRVCVRPINQIQVAMQDIAGMDLDAADHAVVPTSFMSDIRQMQTDFNVMIDNLREYRAYVPAALLEANGKTKKTREPPEGDVAIMFTDIKGSTALWKECAVGMNAALETHNETIRSLYDRYDAYEVKTIGDAFMISFSDPLKAVKMGTQIQQALAKQEWPGSLSFPDAGMVIRIGINYGPVVTESNPMTGRVDYRGSTVNCAARVEAKALGGCTCVTKAVMDAVGGKLGGAGIHSQGYGKHELKGLGEGYELFLLVPAGQKHRFKEETSDCFTNKLRPIRSGLGAERSPGSAMHINAAQSNIIDTVSVRSGPAASELSGVTSVHDATGMVASHRRTGVQLNRGSCTVAVCKLTTHSTDYYFDHCNLMVRAASEAALATDGMVGHVGGRTLTIFWNASKRCRAHPTAALRFAALMEPRTGGVLRVGLASGQMLHGNVGTQKQRFATTIGMPLEAAQLLVDYAQKLGEFCLAADCTMDSRLIGDSTLYSCLRLFDVWEEMHTLKRLHVFYANMAMCKEQIANAAMDTDASGELAYSLSEYSTAKGPSYTKQTEWVRTVLREGRRSTEGSAALLELDALATANPQDRMLKMIVEQLVDSDPAHGVRGTVSLLQTPVVGGIIERVSERMDSQNSVKSAIARVPSAARTGSGLSATAIPPLPNGRYTPDVQVLYSGRALLASGESVPQVASPIMERADSLGCAADRSISNPPAPAATDASVLPREMPPTIPVVTPAALAVSPGTTVPPLSPPPPPPMSVSPTAAPQADAADVEIKVRMD